MLAGRSRAVFLPRAAVYIIIFDIIIFDVIGCSFAGCKLLPLKISRICRGGEERGARARDAASAEDSLDQIRSKMMADDFKATIRYSLNVNSKRRTSQQH